MDFKKLYFTLFNTLSDAVEHINTHDYEEARLLLIHAQQEAEECYIAGAANSCPHTADKPGRTAFAALPGLHGEAYHCLFITFLQNSIRIVATCSRDAPPCGSRYVWPPLLAPEIRPSATASASASFAQPETLPASG